ncbi:hypothetical protein HUU53_04465, partial [Candidatus Micrarchaeota archaeon]|nr:hypothetical protein [Candidatus Micrarchaeota archaeon]
EFIRKKIKSIHEISKVKIASILEDKKRVYLEIIVFLDVDGNVIEKQLSFDLPLEKQLCEECLLHKGSYHEAILQIRGEREKAEKLAAKLIAQLEKKTFIVKSEFKKEGVDIQIGRKRALVEMLSKLGMAYTTSNKLVGATRDGRKQLRLTACIRL